MEQNQSIIKGIIGALLGAMICAIPWLIAYWLGFIFAILALPISYGAFQGYMLFHGKPTKALPAIIAFSCCFIISICIFIIIPVITLLQDDLPVSLEMIGWYFSSSELLKATLKDFAYAVLFSLFGMFPFIQNLNRIQPIKKKEKVEPQENSYKMNLAQRVENIKNTFIEHDALSKTNAVLKEELQIDSQERHLFKQLLKQKIIRKKRRKYYFDEKSENSYWRRFILIFSSLCAKTCLAFLFIFIIIMIFI